MCNFLNKMKKNLNCTALKYNDIFLARMSTCVMNNILLKLTALQIYDRFLSSSCSEAEALPLRKNAHVIQIC